MSGGSYDYLCYKDSQDIRSLMRQLADMAERLSGLEYARDAAQETTALLLTLRQQDVLVSTYIDRLSGVWHAVEWWDSQDSGEEAVKEALTRYRAKRGSHEADSR